MAHTQVEVRIYHLLHCPIELLLRALALPCRDGSICALARTLGSICFCSLDLARGRDSWEGLRLRAGRRELSRGGRGGYLGVVSWGASPRLRDIGVCVGRVDRRGHFRVAVWISRVWVMLIVGAGVE